MKVLIDTNVILDFFLARQPQNEAAKKLFELAYLAKITLFTTASSITDIYYITAKRLGDRTARDVLRNLFNLLTIITVDREDCFTALNLPIPDYEDALVTACAKKSDMDCIVTQDTDFLNLENPLPQVVDPSAFLGLLHEGDDS